MKMLLSGGRGERRGPGQPGGGGTLQGLIVEAAGTILTGDSGRQASWPTMSEGAGGLLLMRRKVACEPVSY